LEIELDLTRQREKGHRSARGNALNPRAAR
jgi:hypothetical protein